METYIFCHNYDRPVPYFTGVTLKLYSKTANIQVALIYVQLLITMDKVHLKNHGLVCHCLPILRDCFTPLVVLESSYDYPSDCGATLKNMGKCITWTGNLTPKGIMLMKFSSLAAPEVVIFTTSGAASYENFIRMIFSLQKWQLPVPVMKTLSKW